MSCNRHSLGALLLTLAVSLAGLLLAYGATGLAPGRSTHESILKLEPTTLSAPLLRGASTAEAQPT